MAFWALRSFAAATIFIAEVIFSVLLTEFILVFISFNELILSHQTSYYGQRLAFYDIEYVLIN